MAPVAMLPQILRNTSLSDLTLSVQIAPGADLSAASSTWTFTDVTEDVLFDKNIGIDMGRGDEQSEAQTATCVFSLLNDSATYTPRKPGTRFFPNMRIGFPVKVVLNCAFMPNLEIFSGYVDELAPSWDESTRVPTVAVTAHGSLQRIQQGSEPLVSTIGLAARDPAFAANVAAYWPLTDGTRTNRIVSGIPGGGDLMLSGTMDFASYSGFDCSEPVAKFGAGSNISGAVKAADTTNNMAFRCLLYAATSLADTTALFQFSGTGTVKQWYVRYRTGGGLSVTGHDDTGASVYDSGAIGFSLAGQQFLLGVELAQNGGNVDVNVWVTRQQSDGTFTPTGVSLSATSVSMGKIYNFAGGGNGSMTDWAIGQIGVANTQSWIDDLTSAKPFSGYLGEGATDRITRVCGQAGFPVIVDGSSGVQMGPQPVNASALDAIKECEAADHGFLFDGQDFGLVYNARPWYLNVINPDMSLDIRDGQVMPPFEPVENTRLVRNDVTVTREDGGSARAVAGTGDPYDPDLVGSFSTSLTLNLNHDQNLAGHAGWLLHLGTVDSDRYPTLTLDFSASPSLIKPWLTMGSNVGFISGRVAVTGLPSTGGSDPSVFIEGMSLIIGPQDWNVQLNCSPAAPYDVGLLNDLAGSNNALEAALDSTGSTLTNGVVVGDTSFLVFGPGNTTPWTTTAADFPIDFYVGGYKFTVTAISTGSPGVIPQTFTLASPSTVTTGGAVKLWRPSYLGL